MAEKSKHANVRESRYKVVEREVWYLTISPLLFLPLQYLFKKVSYVTIVRR